MNPEYILPFIARIGAVLVWVAGWGPAFLAEAAVPADAVSRLAELPPAPSPASVDWLIQPVAAKAGIYRGPQENLLVLDNGLVRREFLLQPNLACVGFQQRTTGESLLRAVRPEAKITLNGKSFPIGGLHGQPVGNYLLPEWYEQLQADPDAFQFEDFQVRPLKARFPWKKRREWMPHDRPWPPHGIEVIFEFVPPKSRSSLDLTNWSAEVHYALYDGLPLIAKWLTLHNGGHQPVKLNTFTSEILAFVEATSEVETLVRPRLPNVHVETDFTTVAMSGESAQRESVHWLPDPDYTTQVNYRLETPCVLECRPPLGPAITLQPGDSFTSFRTWILAHDATDHVRQSLALGSMYRTIAPWVTENPLIMHVRYADPPSVRRAIDQCAEVGFDLVIMTFGSGFNLENEAPGYRRQITELVDYAHRKGIALGGYSLLASRSVGPEHDVVNPETGKPGGFATFGNSPCLASAWGKHYFDNLYEFYQTTGCDVLEHDGSYPGDACASTTHPGHQSYADSRWRQWEIITQFYQWCRGQGIYLNVPDWYFLHGSNKTGMGYRETNWSLPRPYQEIIERQNIYDGTRFKTPTMGWMFVPLTEYHGGGAAATIEPLHEHLDHYERRLANLLGAGVQACYRGPRLYDSPETKAVVKKWVDFYHQHEGILTSDLIPLRRADGRDWDGWLHVNPKLSTRGLAMLYNPLPHPIQRTITLPLYYTGLARSAEIETPNLPPQTLPLQRNYSLPLPIEIPAHAATWAIIRQPTRK